MTGAAPLPRRRTFDPLSALLARICPSLPRTALSLACASGALRNRFTRRWPTPEEVATLFPHLSARGARNVATAIGALEERNEVLVRSIRRTGVETLRPLVSPSPALARLTAPCILGTFHVGALHTIGVALEAAGRPVLAFREGVLFTPRAPIEVQSTAGNEQERAAAFLRALAQLRRGGIVLMSLDMPRGAVIETSCLAQQLPLARGAFALAQRSGAAIVPTVVRWRGAHAEVEIDAPLQVPATVDRSGDPAAFERRLAQSAASWLERYLQRAPHELTLGLLRELLYARP